MKKLSKSIIKSLLKPRKVSSHKGNHGHALLIAGNKGYMGAAIIAARACLRTGTGLLTINVPEEERFILQVAIPEGMIAIREKNKNNFTDYSAIGIGPGLGISIESTNLLKLLLNRFKKPLLLDADALNIISINKELLKKIPKGSIITPHPKEFDRMFGNHTNDKERMSKAIELSNKYDFVIVLKGANTLITYKGESYMNTSGNAGLAKAGSGDGLTGVITAFLAQGYEPFNAAKAGVYLHGVAADIALGKQSVESMLITDVIECMGKAFKKVMD